MRHCRRNLRRTFCCATASGILALCGCGDTCFVGFVSNGKSGVAVATGSLAPACPPQRVNGAMRVLAMKSPACESCARDLRAEHILLTVSGVALRPNTSNEPNRRDWVEIAPQLRAEPRQIDLVGDEPAEILADSLSVPAASYGAIRLELLQDYATEARQASAKNACPGTHSNCVVLAGGKTEPVLLPGDLPELILAVRSPDSGSVFVLPGAGLDLQLTLEPHWMPYFSDTRGWKLEPVLAGSASMGRRWSLREEDH